MGGDREYRAAESRKKKKKKERERKENAIDLVYAYVSFSLEQEAFAIIASSFPFLLGGWIWQNFR